MRIVCTHEQADFDAIASLLGVAILDPETYPVLPRRVNRNVQAFLNLYSGGMPFVRYEDLPREAIDVLTLVDTQSSPSVKGLSKDTEVHVIDHHPDGDDREGEWTFHVEELGATATLLTEQLRDQAKNLRPIEATLLLLGIYEDTGSLSYAGTTVRDVHACAWLLEQGAQIGLLSEFLDHPLTDGQKELYKRLVESAETIEIKGLSIVIAEGVAGGLTEEISTLAHKLRDLYDPDGLFVIVALDGHVQLVARATTWAIDVARVAEAFGGGGHARAAAALIRDTSLDVVRKKLLDELQGAIEPGRTVGEIMSRDPQLFDPDMKIKDAAERMQRFGHEGYPVVRAGDIRGLLTRGAVDRALTHGMGQQSISKIMKAGGISIAKDAPVSQLQDLMIVHGWGQVPVTDPTNDEIIGIVTRTDLIGAIGNAVEPEDEGELVETLRSALPPQRLALLLRIAQIAEQRKDALYIVGGFVRDLLLGSPSEDFDLVVEGDAIGLAQDLAERYGGRVSSHRRFGTAKWQIDSSNKRLIQDISSDENGTKDLPAYLDFVTARTEFYTHPTALPSVERGSIKLDLHRRDFTINTLAMRLDEPFRGQLLDYWGGGRDLREKKLRVLHSLSFVDDPTRILRAIRLEQRLGFEIVERTRELMSEAIALIDRVSGERIRSELDLIFKEPIYSGAMNRLHDLGVLEAIHPRLTWDDWLEDKFRAALSSEFPSELGIKEPPEVKLVLYGLWLLRLDPKEITTIAKRLRFTGSMRADLLDAQRLCAFLCDMPEGMAISEIVERLDDSRERSLMIVYRSLDSGSEAEQAVIAYLSQWRKVQPVATGDTLRDRGIPPGPRYRELLWTLRAAWLDGKVVDPAGEQGLLDQLLEDGKQDG